MKIALLLNFGQKETKFGVTRETVKAMRVQLGLPTDTQVVLYALARLRDSMLPRYEKDNGPVPAAMIKHIRSTVNQELKGGKSLC